MTDLDRRVRSRFATLARKLQQRDNLAAWQVADALLGAAIALGIHLRGHAYTAAVLRSHADRCDAAARQRDEARRPLN